MWKIVKSLKIESFVLKILENCNYKSSKCMMSLIREFSYFLPVFDQNELKTKIYKIYQKLTEISNIPNITGN